MHSLTPTLVTLLLAFTVQARDVPSNIQSFYTTIKNQGSCSNKLATGFYSTDGGSNSTYFPSPIPLSPFSLGPTNPTPQHSPTAATTSPTTTSCTSKARAAASPTWT
jgi:hypothetical protein